MKRIMSICLIIVLLMNFIPMNVIAATQQSYEVSDTINATLSSDGVLTISGSGEMPDYTERKLAPWNGENIKKVELNFQTKKQTYLAKNVGQSGKGNIMQ